MSPTYQYLEGALTEFQNWQSSSRFKKFQCFILENVKEISGFKSYNAVKARGLKYL